MNSIKKDHRTGKGTHSNSLAPINLECFDTFVSHPLVKTFEERYDSDAIRAHVTLEKLVADLWDINNEYKDKNSRGAFTSVEGRVKTKDSFMMKLYKICLARAPNTGINKKTIGDSYKEIKDLCGIRFSCPYYDEVKFFVNNLVRPKLQNLGYQINFNKHSQLMDKDYLDQGNEQGYRSYHFFVKVPTEVDIYGKIEPCLCEIQARSELQHIWAVKSHDLLYKPKNSWDFSDVHVLEDMRQLGNSLRSADQFLISIRDRVKDTNKDDPSN